MSVKSYFTLPGGLKMPSVGLGTGTLRDEAIVESILTRAFELGYRHFDTAYLYTNERLIGQVLKKWFSSGKVKREDLFITTKLPPEAIHESKVEEYMKKSLENLQLDYVDLYLIHIAFGVKKVDGQDIMMDANHVAIWKKMEEQVDAGRTKAIGLSNFNIKQIEKIQKSARIKPACLQVELHVDFQQRELVNFCHKNNIVVVAYSPLGAPGRQTAVPRRIAHKLDDATVKKIAEKHRKTTAQIMLRYLLQNDIVVIPYTKTLERLKENIDVFDFSLDSDDLKQLDGLEEGEIARIALWTRFQVNVKDHPEYPFPLK